MNKNGFRTFLQKKNLTRKGEKPEKNTKKYFK